MIIVSFLGAMLATQRRKHINIDALSKLLPAGARRLVAVLMPLFALGICLVLASAGWDLVQISREFPKELLPFAQEWHMQLMFPVGFGLMALHFAVRVVEAAMPEEPKPEKARPSQVVTRVDDEDDDVAEAEAEAKAAAAERLDEDDSRPQPKAGTIGAVDDEPDEPDDDPPESDSATSDESSADDDGDDADEGGQD